MTPDWWRLLVTSRPDQTDAIAATIVAATGNGVEEPSPGLVTTTLESEPAALALAMQIEQEFAGTSTSVTATERVDWTLRWRDGIATRRFGRLLLTPSWLPVEATPPDTVVSIDPESAFGSGEHGSTRGALVLLERHLRDNDRVLDLGSGSGILAIAAVRLGARSAVGIEVDDEALPVAEANARRNGVSERVRFVAGDAGELAPLAAPVEVVCSNILRSVNVALLPSIARALAPGGIAVFAGMESTEASLFAPVLAEQGWNVVDEVTDAGWWSVAARLR